MLAEATLVMFSRFNGNCGESSNNSTVRFLFILSEKMWTIKRAGLWWALLCSQESQEKSFSYWGPVKSENINLMYRHNKTCIVREFRESGDLTVTSVCPSLSLTATPHASVGQHIYDSAVISFHRCDFLLNQAKIRSENQREGEDPNIKCLWFTGKLGIIVHMCWWNCSSQIISNFLKVCTWKFCELS